MQGERRNWYRIASHLGVPLQYLLQTTTSKEMVEWLVVIDNEEEKISKQDVYFARMIAEIRRSWVAEPENVTVGEFLINFEKKEKKLLPLEQRIEISKAAWGAITKIGKKK